MTSVGAEAATPDPADLTELSVTRLLEEIARDHETATAAGKTQGERLDLMGQKAAEVWNRGEMTWRELADKSGIALRTLYRYADPYVDPKKRRRKKA